LHEFIDIPMTVENVGTIEKENVEQQQTMQKIKNTKKRKENSI